jgi:hypothetical protein
MAEQLDGINVDEWHELLENYRTLGPTAREVLMLTSRRLAHGKRQYNDDFDQPRDWARETLEEAADQAIYAQVGLIKLAKK